MARCDWMLGRLARAAGDTTAAGEHLVAAAGSFRARDYLPELAITLADLAEHARTSNGHLDAADRHATEAITIAAPRRAGARPGRRPGSPGPHPRQPGDRRRGPGPARTRAATPPTPRCGWLPGTSWPGTNWTHCAPTPPSTRAEDTDRGWAAKAGIRHARLVPPGLDPDPLATVERLVAAQEAAEDGREGGEH